MFSEKYPIAWSFHKNTSRWINVYPPMPLAESEEVLLYKEYPNVPIIELTPTRTPQTKLSDTILQRHSCRNYTNSPLKLQELALLLESGYGIKGVKSFEKTHFFERMIPSGGGLYPLELYLIVLNLEGVPPGIYHYAIRPAILEQILLIELPALFISQLFIDQPYISQSGVILIATSFIERNMKKYGDRGYRYTLFEAGHLFQNINLMATALNLGTLNLGGFLDEQLANLLQIDIEKEIPLYAMAIGNK
jgi:SagB-type dehydrogenase family enzyme